MDRDFLLGKEESVYQGGTLGGGAETGRRLEKEGRPPPWSRGGYWKEGGVSRSQKRETSPAQSQKVEGLGRRPRSIGGGGVKSMKQPVFGGALLLIKEVCRGAVQVEWEDAASKERA